MEKLTKRLFLTYEKIRILSRRGRRIWNSLRLVRSLEKGFGVGGAWTRSWDSRHFPAAPSQRRSPSSCSRRIIANTGRISFLDSVGGVAPQSDSVGIFLGPRDVARSGDSIHDVIGHSCARHLAKRAWRGNALEGLRAVFCWTFRTEYL